MRNGLLLLLAPLILTCLESRTEAQSEKGPKPIEVQMLRRSKPVSFAGEVTTFLESKCVGCHNEALAENKLILETVDAMKQGGKSGPALVPGNADASLLFKMAAHRVEPVMPPADKKNLKPLTSDELGLLKLWINEGAKDDSDDVSEEASPIILGSLPPGVHPINAVDMTDDGTRVVCGRANVVQVFDVDSGLEIIQLGGHQDIVQSVRFSPNGKLLAAGSFEVVTLWNVPTGGLKTTFEGHADQVKALSALPGGAGFVSGSLDKSLRFWNPDGKQAKEYKLASPILATAVSPDGRSIAVGCEDHQVRILSLADGKELSIWKGHEGPVTDLAYLPDGNRLASASLDGKVRIWSLSAPAEGESKPNASKVLTGSEKPIRALVALPDGRTIVAAGDDGKIRFWDPEAESVEPSRTLDAHDAPILALAVGPKGNLILTGSADKTAKLIGLATGTARLTLSSHQGPVNSVAFSEEGTRLLTAGAEGGVKVWEATTGQGVIAFGHKGVKDKPIQPLQKVLALAGGVVVSASADHTIKSWTFEGAWTGRRPLGPHASRVLALDFSPDGTLLAAGGGEPSRTGEIKIWEVGKGLPVRTLDNVHSDTVFGLRFSPDGSRLASAGADKFLKVTRTSDGKELKGYEGHTHHVLAVDWNSDGKQLVSAGADNVLKVWDAESGEQVRTIQGAGKQVTSVRWVPGKPEIAGASGDKTVRVWNSGNGSVLRSFTGAGDYVFAVGTSKDGARLAAGGADGVLLVWDRQNGQVIRKLEPEVQEIPKARAGR